MEQELAIKLQDDGIRYQTQVEIPVTTADFYFPLETRPLVVFVDGRVHLGTAQMAKDEELRTILRKKDTESWSYATTATRTRKETVFTKKFGAASPSWLASHQILRQTERPDTHPRRSNIVALPYVRVCVEESPARRACQSCHLPVYRDVLETSSKPIPEAVIANPA